jgi:hypothetical protein
MELSPTAAIVSEPGAQGAGLSNGPGPGSIATLVPRGNSPATSILVTSRIDEGRYTRFKLTCSP